MFTTRTPIHVIALGLLTAVGRTPTTERSVRWNGERIDGWRVEAKKLAHGGTLTFEFEP